MLDAANVMILGCPPDNGVTRSLGRLITSSEKVSTAVSLYPGSSIYVPHFRQVFGKYWYNKLLILQRAYDLSIYLFLMF